MHEEAKTQPSKSLALVESGEATVIAPDGKPAKRRFGVDRGQFEVPADFDAPLDDEVLQGFESAGRRDAPKGS